MLLQEGFQFRHSYHRVKVVPQVAVLVSVDVQGLAVAAHFALHVAFGVRQLGLGEVDDRAALLPVGDEAVGPGGAVGGRQPGWHLGH